MRASLFVIILIIVFAGVGFVCWESLRKPKVIPPVVGKRSVLTASAGTLGKRKASSPEPKLEWVEITGKYDVESEPYVMRGIQAGDRT